MFFWAAGEGGVMRGRWTTTGIQNCAMSIHCAMSVNAGSGVVLHHMMQDEKIAAESKGREETVVS